MILSGKSFLRSLFPKPCSNIFLKYTALAQLWDPGWGLVSPLFEQLVKFIPPTMTLTGLTYAEPLHSLRSWYETTKDNPVSQRTLKFFTAAPPKPVALSCVSLSFWIVTNSDPVFSKTFLFLSLNLHLISPYYTSSRFLWLKYRPHLVWVVLIDRAPSDTSIKARVTFACNYLLNCILFH